MLLCPLFSTGFEELLITQDHFKNGPHNVTGRRLCWRVMVLVIHPVTFSHIVCKGPCMQQSSVMLCVPIKEGHACYGAPVSMFDASLYHPLAGAAVMMVQQSYCKLCSALHTKWRFSLVYTESVTAKYIGKYA